MKPFDEQLVSGSVLRSVWKLSWPLVLLNLVNGMHGFVDHVLVGHFIGGGNNAANAAIGVAWQVFLVVVVFVSSIFHGTNVLIARCAGRQDREALSHVFYSSLLCAGFILFFVMAPAGWFAAPWLLRFVEASPEVTAHALPYLRILFTLGAPLFLIIMFTGAFNASGDPKTPLKLGVLATTLNVLISLVLVPGLGPFPKLGVTGAALGTVIAPMVSVCIAAGLVLRGKMIIQPPRRYTFFPDFRVMAAVVRIGVPTGVQGVLLNIGGVFLIKYIGGLENGAAAQAAYTICYAQLFSLVTWASFGLRAASGTLMGQNIGAGNPVRGRAAVRLSAWIGAGWGLAVGLAFWAAPGALLLLFNVTEEPSRAFGLSLLRWLSISGVVLASTLALTGGLQGAGETKSPMYIAFISQIVVLLGICQALQMAGLLTAERVWMAIFIAQASRFVMTWAKFRTEDWAHIRIEIPRSGPDEEALPGEM